MYLTFFGQKKRVDDVAWLPGISFLEFHYFVTRTIIVRCYIQFRFLILKIVPSFVKRLDSVRRQRRASLLCSHSVPLTNVLGYILRSYN